MVRDTRCTKHSHLKHCNHRTVCINVVNIVVNVTLKNEICHCQVHQLFLIGSPLALFLSLNTRPTVDKLFTRHDSWSSMSVDSPDPSRSVSTPVSTGQQQQQQNLHRGSEPQPLPPHRSTSGDARVGTSSEGSDDRLFDSTVSGLAGLGTSYENAMDLNVTDFTQLLSSTVCKRVYNIFHSCDPVVSGAQIGDS